MDGSTSPLRLPTREPGVGALLPQDLDDHPFGPPPVELRVEDLLPRAEIEASGGHRDDHLVMDEQVLEMAVAVVLAAAWWR